MRIGSVDRMRVHVEVARHHVLAAGVDRLRAADDADLVARRDLHDPGAVDDDALRIDLTVAAGETTVLGKAQVRVRRGA